MLNVRRPPCGVTVQLKHTNHVSCLPPQHNKHLSAVLDNQAWQGQRCFIIGGGPSLADFDFSQLNGELVIGVNRAYEKIDPAVLFSMDTRFIVWAQANRFGTRELYNNLRATKVLLNLRAISDWYYIRPVQLPEFSIDMNVGFSRVNNSGFGAVNLAIALGCSTIYLLGFDMGDPNDDGEQKWWHSGYPSVQRNVVYQDFRATFERESKSMLQHSDIVNLNPDSRLTCFPFGRFEELQPGPERPIIVGYYTKDTGYEQEAQQMIRSVHRFGFETDVVPVATMGGWQANTRYKATFLRQMLDKHAPHPIVYLDADAEMKQYPVLLNDMTADVAYVQLDWANYGKRNRAVETLSGTLYLANNDAARTLVDKWIEKNRHNPQRWEQANLQDVLKELPGLHIEHLPDTYCEIFDLMKAAGLPVIVQKQASRRLKKEVDR